MKMQTKFFGTVEYQETEIIHFQNGLPGFEEKRRFIVINPPESVFSCLQSLDDQAVAFITVSPFLLFTEYSFTLDQEIPDKLKLNSSEDALILAIVSIPQSNPEQATANLQAPLVINQKAGLGCQIILNDEQFPLRLPIWKDEKDQVMVGK